MCKIGLRIIPQNFLIFDEICGEKSAETQTCRMAKKQKDRKSQKAEKWTPDDIYAARGFEDHKHPHVMICYINGSKLKYSCALLPAEESLTFLTFLFGFTIIPSVTFLHSLTIS